MNKTSLQLACVFAALAVGFGAFAAHGLKNILSNDTTCNSPDLFLTRIFYVKKNLL